MQNFISLLFALLVSSLAANEAWHTLCAKMSALGIERLAAEGKKPNALAKVSKSLAPQQQLARVYQTEHFAILYVVRGVNQIAWSPSDSLLRRKIDSLHLHFSPSFKPNQIPPASAALDSNVFKSLDSLGLGHPYFAKSFAEKLEAARQKYVTEFKMLAPALAKAYRYKAFEAFNGKYTVEIGDIIDLEGNFPQTYGLTFYPEGNRPETRMVQENDFISGTKLDSLGKPYGDSIRSSLSDSTLFNYARDVEKGIKITCFHEFYHAVQLSYSDFRFHVWYEAGAVGMEILNAPEIPDYLQYLPSLFRNYNRVGLLELNDPLHNYALGTLVTLMRHYLGEDFDAAVWAELKSNGNKIGPALQKVVDSKSTSMQNLLAYYGAWMLEARQGSSGNSPVLCEAQSLWPRLNASSLKTPNDTVTLHPYGFNIMEINSNFKKPFLQLKSQAEKIAALRLPAMGDFGPVALSTQAIEFNADSGHSVYLILSNGKSLLSSSVTVNVVDLGTSVLAYPNPISLSSGQNLSVYFPVDDQNSVMGIFNEYGKTIRGIGLAVDAKKLSWDLKNQQGQRVSPGVYYLRKGQKLQSVLILTE